jgi:hypothetical protein
MRIKGYMRRNVSLVAMRMAALLTDNAAKAADPASAKATAGARQKTKHPHPLG